MSDGDSECINCGAEVRESYCGVCGQPANPKRLTWKTFWSDFLDRIYSIDTRFLRTVVGLTIRPGTVAKQFIEGNRVLYVPPMSYFLITITLYILFLGLIGLSVADTMSEAQEMMAPDDQTDGQIRFASYISENISEYMRTFSFLQIPFVAMAAMMFFKKDQYTFIEHNVLALYTHGHLAFLGLMNAVLIKNEISSGTIIIPIISIVYYGFACSQFYTTGKVRGVLKGMIAHVLSWLFFVIFFVIVLVAGLFVYIRFINPEFLDTL